MKTSATVLEVVVAPPPVVGCPISPNQFWLEPEALCWSVPEKMGPT